jgi:hypothetical protein
MIQTDTSYLRRAQKRSMGQLAIINAPSTFTFIWTAIKPWLAPETVAKISILGVYMVYLFCIDWLTYNAPLEGSNYADVLLQHIDAENLPESFGGTCSCEGLGGCMLSSAGPWLAGRIYSGHGPSKYGAKSLETMNVIAGPQSERVTNGL